MLNIFTILPRNIIMSKEFTTLETSSMISVITMKIAKNGIFLGQIFQYWMSSKEFVKTWNVCDEEKYFKLLQNRTNNTLERFNLYNTFSVPRSSLSVFVATLEGVGRNQVARLESIGQC